MQPDRGVEDVEARDVVTTIWEDWLKSGTRGNHDDFRVVDRRVLVAVNRRRRGLVEETHFRRVRGPFLSRDFSVA